MDNFYHQAGEYSGGTAPRGTQASKKKTKENGKNKTNQKGKQKAPKDTPDDASKASYASKKQEKVDDWKKSLTKEIPEPFPQKTLKKDFLNGIDFEVVDSHALTAPKALLNSSFWDLVQYMTGDDVFDDLVRVRSIYRWITSFDIEIIDVGPDPKPDTPMEYFSKIQCHMGNIANLFYILCTMAEVPCKVIDGITKNEYYKMGEPETEEMKSQWNAVYVQKEWRLVDVFWAKSCVMVNSGEDDDSMMSSARSLRAEDVDDEYFFTDAEDLIWTHHPDEEKWQLQKKTLSRKDFLERLYVRERSRELGITFPQTNAIINVQNGKANFELNFPHKRGENYHFKHNFTRMVTHEDEPPRRLDKILHHFILFERHDDKISFVFNIPVLGKFRVNIFASDPATDGLEKFDMICSVIVISSKLNDDYLPLPDYPKIGWGPTKISRRLGLIPITHEESSIFTTTGILEIEVGAKFGTKLEMKLVNPFVDSTNMAKYAMMYWNHGRYIVKTRLPKTGIYGLKFFKVNLETMEHENVLNYIIHCSMPKGSSGQSLPHIAQTILGAHPTVERLGVVAANYENGFIETPDGHASMEFMKKSDVELIGELHSNDPEAIARMRLNPYKTKGQRHGFALDVPIKGEYGFNVYATKKDEPGKLLNAYAFLVISHGRNISIGTVKSKILGKHAPPKQIGEVKTESIKTVENEISIPVPRGIDKLSAFLQKADRSEPQSCESVERVTEKGIEIYKVKLDDLGDYTFNVYQNDNHCLGLIRSYYITRNDDAQEIEDDVKEVIEIIKEERELSGTDVTDMERYMAGSRIKTYVDVERKIASAQKLAEALKTNDPERIRLALLDYQRIHPDVQDDLIRNSKREIKVLEAKYDILRAYQARELTYLERAIANASAVNDDGSFDQQLTLATRLKDRLAALRTMQALVRNTDNRMIGELRQYNIPPVGVHQTVTAALMLLGYEESDVKTWKQCQKILGQKGDKSFLTQMSKFDTKDANLALAFEAKKIVQPFTVEQVHAGSHEAASIFIWVNQMIKSIEASAGTLGENKMVPQSGQAKAEIRKQTEAPKPDKVATREKTELVTLESLLIDPDMLKPEYDRHNRLIKPKTKKSTKDTKQSIKTNSVKSLPDTKKTAPKEKPQDELIKEKLKELKMQESQPKDFIKKNIKKSKIVTDENNSSYLKTYFKKNEERLYDDDDCYSVDGHLSIPEALKNPGSSSYHGDDPLSHRGNRDNKGNFHDDQAKKKQYKEIYNKRKDEKEAIERMWAKSIKMK